MKGSKVWRIPIGVYLGVACRWERLSIHLLQGWVNRVRIGFLRVTLDTCRRSGRRLRFLFEKIELGLSDPPADPGLLEPSA
jgi:hypothetical protein